MGSNGYWRGPSNLNEIAATLDMPGMHRKTFVSIEKQIGQAWETLLAEEMTKAGEEERQLGGTCHNWLWMLGGPSDPTSTVIMPSQGLLSSLEMPQKNCFF